MSDTPRTDSGCEYDQTTTDDVIEWARQLERELKAANERIKQLESENDALRADLLLWNEKEPTP